MIRALSPRLARLEAANAPVGGNLAVIFVPKGLTRAEEKAWCDAEQETRGLAPAAQAIFVTFRNPGEPDGRTT